MKRLFAVILCLVLSLTAVAACADTIGMVGGWEVYASEEAILPDEASGALEEALKGLVGAEYTPVALLATQIVAGTNYCILCRVTPVVPDAVPAWALVYVYADLEGGAQILAVTDLDIDLPQTGE